MLGQFIRSADRFVRELLCRAVGIADQAVRASLILALATGLIASGCAKPADTAAQQSAASATAPEGKPQPKLPTLKLWVGPEEIVSEIATTDDEIHTGMMFRKEMAEHEGMLFLFARPYQASFWMKNTILPLTCAYIDAKGTILELRDMKPHDETPIVAQSDQVQYVLEMNQGWFARKNIRPGMVFRTERGTFAETFFARQ